jgi:hypothetical protein
MSKTRPESVPNESRDGIETSETPVSVADAARVLGITEDGVRKALRRGTIAGSKNDRGVWQVHLSPQDTAHDVSRMRPETDETAPQDTSRDRIETGALALVDQLRSENAYLREELHNTHVLLAQMTARIPHLTAGGNDEVSGDLQTDSARPGATGEATEGSETKRRRWWEVWR